MGTIINNLSWRISNKRKNIKKAVDAMKHATIEHQGGSGPEGIIRSSALELSFTPSQVLLGKMKLA